MSLTLLTTSGTAPGVTPAIVDSGWSRTSSGIVRKALVTASADTLTGFSDSSICSVHSSCLGQWLYGPLAAQTISGTLTGKIVAKDSTFGNIYISRMAAWIATSAGALRSTLLSATSDPAAVLWTTSYGTYTIGPTSLTSQTCTAGDYLVLEAGLDDTTFTNCEVGTIRAGSGGTYFILSNTLQLFNPASVPSVIWLGRPQPKR